MRIFHVLLMTLCALFAATGARAQATGAFGGGPAHIDARLSAESLTPAPGSRVTIAFIMRPEQGWHGYWENPGDAGLGMTVKWTLPQGVKVGALRYPVPETLLVADLMNHVYEGPYAVLAAIDVPASMKPGDRLPVKVRADWLACTEQVCVPEGGDLSVDLVVGDGKAGNRAAFDAYRAHLPRPLGSVATYQIVDGRLRLSVPFPAQAQARDVHLFGLDDRLASYAAPQSVTRDGDRLLIETQAGKGATGAAEAVLRTGPHEGFALKAMPGVVADGRKAAGIETILIALGGAILGGLILNIMPCVFPILALKALSLARAGGNERVVRREAVAYALGVVIACMALGGLLLALRAAGVAAGWAFQLQDPRVILLLLLLAVAITLNLAGLFELRAVGAGQELAGKGGWMGAFWTGALVAFVATPCTGPFMGAAMGAALVLPVGAALAIFAGLGLGLALPFLLLAYVPALRTRLPRPGAWMGRFQKIMAVPMALTALGLAWLLWRQRGEEGLGIGFLAALLLGGMLIYIGKRQQAGFGATKASIVALALCVVSISSMPYVDPRTEMPADGIVVFDQAKLTALRKAGRPVFLYFTADWCLSCKANEAGAIDRAETMAAFKKADVIVMVGDWTNADPAITRFLEAKGRSGVPLYLWYAPGRQAKELPQILTPGLLAGLAGHG